MKKTLITLGILMVASAVMAAPTIHSLTLEESSHYGATHSIDIQASDFAAYTTQTTNVVISFTNVITAPVSVRFVAYKLDIPFWSVNNTNSNLTMPCSVGIAASPYSMISSNETCLVATPTVYGDFGIQPTVNIAATGTVTTITDNRVLNDQTSNVSLVVSFNPSHMKPSDLKQGRVRIFLQVFGQGWDQR